MATASVSNGTTERLNLQDEINRKLAQARGICKVIQLADFSEIFPGEALQLAMWGVHDMLNDIDALAQRLADTPPAQGANHGQ